MMKKIFTLGLTILIGFFSLVGFARADKPTEPKASVDSGTAVLLNTHVVFKAAVKTDTIYYRGNSESEFVKATTKYDSVVVIITKDTLFEVFAVNTDKVHSDTAKFGYTIAVPKPTRTPDTTCLHAGTVVTIKAEKATDTLFYRLGSAGEYTKTVNGTKGAQVVIAKKDTLYSYVKRDNKLSAYDTAEFTMYQPIFEGTMAITHPAAKADHSYTEVDTTFNNYKPKMAAKVTDVEMKTTDVRPSGLLVRLYQKSSTGDDSLIYSTKYLKETFELYSNEGLQDGNYKVEVLLAQRSAEGEKDSKNSFIWTPYKKDGEEVKEVRYFSVAAPALAVTSPEVSSEPVRVSYNKADLTVKVSTKNFNGLIGKNDGQYVIAKRISANSLFVNPDIAGMGGISDAYYVEYQDTLAADGNIEFGLKEGWVDSVKKSIRASVDSWLKAQFAAMEEDYEGEELEDAKAYFTQMAALKEKEDLSDCAIEIAVGKMDCERNICYFALAEESDKMTVSVPFSVIEAPEFSEKPGFVGKGTKVKITAAEGDTLWYALNNDAVTCADTNVVEFTINTTTDLEAYAKNGRLQSAVVSGTYEVVPDFAVKTVGAVADTFNGVATFDVFVRELAANDSLKAYQVKAEVLADEDSFNVLNTFTWDAADSARVVMNDVYNGTYYVHFTLNRLVADEEPYEVGDVDFNITVTNHAEPAIPEDPTITVKPAGNFTIKGDTVVVFTDKNPLFDVLVAKAEGDDNDYTVDAQLFTRAAYEAEDASFASMKHFSFTAADSVRTNFDTNLAVGKYVATFSLEAPRGGEIEYVEVYFEIAEDVPVANEGAELAGVNVYPNPTTGVFNVNVPEGARVEIFGMNGVRVAAREVNVGVASFRLNNSGIYFVRVTAGGKSTVKRVIVR